MTRSRNEQIVEAVKRGETNALIAKTHGLSEQYVSSIIRQAGVFRRERDAPRSLPRLVRDLRRQGLTFGQIRALTGASDGIICLNVYLVDGVAARRAGRSLIEERSVARLAFSKRARRFRDQDRDHHDVDLVDALAIGPSHRELRQFGGTE